MSKVFSGKFRFAVNPHAIVYLAIILLYFIMKFIVSLDEAMWLEVFKAISHDPYITLETADAVVFSACSMMFISYATIQLIIMTDEM